MLWLNQSLAKNYSRENTLCSIQNDKLTKDECLSETGDRDLALL